MPWTPEQDEFLRANYATMRNKDIGAATGHCERRVSDRAIKLGLKGTKSKDVYKDAWRNQRSTLSAEERREKKNARARALLRRKKGLPEDAVLKTGGGRNQTWSDEHTAYVRAHWGKKTPKEIAEHCGKSVKATHAKAAREGLGGAYKKPAESDRRRPRKHPLPEMKSLEPSVAQLAAARAQMKQKPGPMTRGFRVRSTWR